MRLSLILALTLFQGCSLADRIESVPAGSARNLPVIEGNGYSGVIFPADRAKGLAESFGLRVGGYWTPNSELIARLESKLRPALEEESRSQIPPGEPGRRAFLIGEAGKILAHFEEYKRQYVGIILLNGSRRVFLNCFRPSDDPSDGWRQDLVVVDDGGFWFWQIQFDLDSQHFVDFTSNGYV